jgi:hypothetical protein
MKKNLIESAIAAMLPLITGFLSIPLVMYLVGSPVSASQSIAASFIFTFGRFFLYFATRTFFHVRFK